MPPTGIPEFTLSRDGQTWIFDDGTVLPVIAGGQDSGGDGGSGSGDQGAGSGGDAGGSGDGGTSTGTKPEDKTGGSDDADKLGDAGKRALDAERARVKAIEKDLNAANAKIREFEDKGKTEIERLSGRVSELESTNATLTTENQRLKISGRLTAAATTAGAKYPDAIYKLVDPATLEFDDDGEPKNIEKVVTDLRTQYPELFRAGAGQGTADGGTRPDAGTTDMNQRIRRAAGRG